MKFHRSTVALGAALAFALTVPAGAQGTSGSPGHMGKKGNMMMADQKKQVNRSAQRAQRVG